MKKTYLFLLAAFMLAACTPSENNTPKELKGISLNKKSIEVEVDDSYQLRVWYEPEDAEDSAPEVEWESDNTKIAKVSQSGKVTGVKIGKTTVTATCGKFTAECEVEVVKATSEPKNPDDHDDPENQDEVKFSVSPTSIDCTADGGKFTISVSAEGAVWSAESSESWVVLSQKSDLGSADVVVSVESSKSSTETTAEITFECADKTKIVTITRAGVKYFSVSSSKKVRFSSGNLRYQASTSTWSFAENQYDIVGSDNENISSTYSGWIDLFGWGTGQNPTNASSKNSDYPTSFKDWGANPILNGGDESNQWRTLSLDEWKYLIDSRANASSKRGKGKVNGIEGCIFLPDDWTLPSGVSFTSIDYSWSDNQYSVAEWEKMEKNGAIFLPNAGFRYYSSYGEMYIGNVNNSYGHYWTSNPSDTSGKAHYIDFGSDKSYGITTTYHSDKCDGLSVRLVQDL